MGKTKVGSLLNTCACFFVLATYAHVPRSASPRFHLYSLFFVSLYLRFLLHFPLRAEAITRRC